MAWTQIGNLKGPTGSTGSQGPQGNPGVGFTWRGTWSASTPYALNDCVARTNQSYICTAANTGNDPATDTTHWNLMAGAGTSAPSTDAGNIATLGSDSHIYVPNPTPTITAVRLRSLSAVGNGTFEVDQKQCGASFAVTGAGGTGPVIDRWIAGVTGTLRFSVQQIAANVAVPGTSYYITSKIWRVTMTTSQASLGTGDYLDLWTNIEGPMLRELYGDVHSVSILCRSSVANQKFGMSLTDGPQSRALGKLCTLGAANTWALITLPSLPVFPVANFSVNPGAVGYALNIVLAAGTGLQVAANDTWQTTSTLWAPAGIDNFAANAGATFDLAFIQHCPGTNVDLIDKSWSQNYDECLRYFQKSYPYASKAGSTNQGSYSKFQAIGAVSAATYVLYGDSRFSKKMAKSPTCTVYHPNNGSAWQVDGWYATSGTVPNANAALGATSVTNSESNIVAVGMASGTSTAPIIGFFEWTADTGW